MFSGTTLQILELNLEVRHPHLTAVDILCGIDFKSGCEISWVVNQIGIFVATGNKWVVNPIGIFVVTV